MCVLILVTFYRPLGKSQYCEDLFAFLLCCYHHHQQPCPLAAGAVPAKIMYTSGEELYNGMFNNIYLKEFLQFRSDNLAKFFPVVSQISTTVFGGCLAN